MPINEQQLIQRQNHIGSSDMAAILGLNPYQTAYDIWLQKTGQLDYQEPNAAMFIGTMLEDGVLNFAENQLGPLVRNVHVEHDNGILASNIDAEVVEDGRPVEAKTVGIMRGFTDKDQWGDGGSDNVPDYCYIQTHVHMICAKKDLCYVPALLAGRGLLLFHVPFSQDVADVILEKAEGFWNENVLKATPPIDSQPTLDVVKRMKRTPNKEVQIDKQLILTLEEAKEAERLAKKRKDEAQAMILAAMGDAECGVADGLKCTYFTYKRKGYTVQDSEYRTLYTKKER